MHFESENARSCGRGFTLIEIMIVVGIAALVMAWGGPAVAHAVRKDAFRQAVSDVMEGCSHARARAILQGVSMELVITAESGSLAVQPCRDREDQRIPDFGVSTPSAVQAVEGSTVGLKPFSARLSENVAVELLDVNFRDHMELGEARVRFHPNGTSDDFTIVLRSPSGERRTVTLDVLTGLASSGVIQ